MVATRLEGLVEDYLAHCRDAGLSPKTIRHAYGYPLRAVFLPWCSTHEVTEPADLTSRTLDQFVGDLLEHGGKRGQLSKQTAWTYAKAAKRFLAWLKAEGEPVDGEVQLPRLPKRLVETFDRDEIQRLEDAAQTERDALMVRVLADSGVRVGELVRLWVSDLVERERHAFLKGVARASASVSCRLRQCCTAAWSATRSASARGTPRPTSCSSRAGEAG
ncbi:MAG: tyrosine-type recombinase/integrase [Candidatus Dormibacterales bacterium]